MTEDPDERLGAKGAAEVGFNNTTSSFLLKPAFSYNSVCFSIGIKVGI